MMTERKQRERWNRCVRCGRFFSPKELDSGGGGRAEFTPDTAVTGEQVYYTCKHCVVAEVRQLRKELMDRGVTRKELERHE